MLYLIHKLNLIYATYIFILQISIFSYVTATQVTQLSSILDQSLGFEVRVPVLRCHVTYVNYTEVNWYKDYDLLHSGPARLQDHILHIALLMKNDSTDFSNVLKLQGYYWCETDFKNDSFVERYLFKIKEVSTFVGTLFATQDRLADDRILESENKMQLKKSSFEDDMENILFGFLHKPSTYVADMRWIKNGLEVRFYLYTYFGHVINARKSSKQLLTDDEVELETILEYINNETEEVNEDLYRLIVEWTHLKGINIKDIVLRSTLGCYETTLIISTDPIIEITFPGTKINEVSIPDKNCLPEDGVPVTRMCSGSFYSGAKWDKPSSKCFIYTNELTTELRDLHRNIRKVTTEQLVSQLLNFTMDPSTLGATDLHILCNILDWLLENSQLQHNEIQNLFLVIDNLMFLNSTEMMSAKNTIYLTRRLFRIVNRIMNIANEQEGFFFTSKNILVFTRKSKPIDDYGHIVGFTILPIDSTFQHSTVQEILNATQTSKQEGFVSFVLPPELLIERELALMFENKISAVLFKDWTVFPDPSEEMLGIKNRNVIPMPVISISMSGGRVWNLKHPVEIYFKVKQTENIIVDPVCVHFEPKMNMSFGSWITDGCEFGGFQENYYVCRCHHLSTFSILPLESESKRLHSLEMGNTVYLACGFSIVALSFVVILYFLSKLWRSTVDHAVLFWLSLSFLCYLILLLLSDVKSMWRESRCVLLANLMHYFILVAIGWLMVHAVVHRIRFGWGADFSEIRGFILKCCLGVWGLPIFITTIIWLETEYVIYNDKNCWRTIADVSSVASIPIGIFLVITSGVNFFDMYTLACSFNKDLIDEAGGLSDDIIKFRVSFTVFFAFALTWLLGFFALTIDSEDLKILFSFFLTLTSYYIALFFIFQDISFWELCRKFKKKNINENETVKFAKKRSIRGQ